MTLKEIKDYIKDNPNHYWFKRKLYGWGWVPVTWQGWLTILFFLGYIMICAFGLGIKETPTTFDVTLFFVAELVGLAVLILICYRKGEKPKWMWGLPKENTEKQEKENFF